MKRFIKNNIAKILIALSLSLTFALSFAFIPKTYAQDTTNNGYEILPNGIQSKNLWDEIWELGDISSSNGQNVSNNSMWRTKNYIPVLPNTQYHMTTTENNRFDVFYYDTNKNYISWDNTFNNNTKTTPNNCYFIRFYEMSRTTYNKNVMITQTNYAVNYFPYGFYNGENEFDWNNDLLQENERLQTEIDSLKNINFMDYLIGQNYFTEGKIEYRQTTNGTWWDRKLLNSNSSTNSYIGSDIIGQYIEGKQLNISSVYTYLLNNASVSLSRFSEIMLFPSLSLKSNSWNYLSIEARYINIDVYAPNFSGQCRAILSDNGLYTEETSPNVTIVDFAKNGDYFNIRFDSDNLKYLCYIEFSLPYNSSSQTYQVPNYAISNTKDTTTWNLYNLGYDDGYNVQRGEIDGLKSNLENANNSVNVLKARVNDLQEQVNNNFGFKNVFFAMADTPFKTVSNFLGFELFGINLFQALIGFITVLACIWLIKKLI